MGYKINHKNGAVIILIDAKNDGKLRFKNRSNTFDFGQVFSTQKITFGENSYLEWQIGYDAPVNKVNEEILAYLGHKTFVGRNNVIKAPFELFEIYLALIKSNLIQSSITDELHNEIQKYDIFLDTEFISLTPPEDFSINNIEFKKTRINLPTYYYLNSADGTIIEVSIKQQQYASGTQPMIYFCIPIYSFIDGKEMIGKTSVEKETLCYVIGPDNKQNIMNLIRIFGMASQKHHDDILNILSLFRSS
ncbi:MAG: R.Pab1 family restriction endonuclease [Candidatus Aminicenantes bacterium]|nr:R.Pab1 family restriction endonuclease [Candidatus Aminicenantes bacterium]